MLERDLKKMPNLEEIISSKDWGKPDQKLSSLLDQKSSSPTILATTIVTETGEYAVFSDMPLGQNETALFDEAGKGSIPHLAALAVYLLKFGGNKSEPTESDHWFVAVAAKCAAIVLRCKTDTRFNRSLATYIEDYIDNNRVDAEFVKSIVFGASFNSLIKLPLYLPQVLEGKNPPTVVVSILDYVFYTADFHIIREEKISKDLASHIRPRDQVIDKYIPGIEKGFCSQDEVIFQDIMKDNDIYLSLVSFAANDDSEAQFILSRYYAQLSSLKSSSINFNRHIAINLTFYAAKGDYEPAKKALHAMLCEHKYADLINEKFKEEIMKLLGDRIKDKNSIVMAKTSPKEECEASLKRLQFLIFSDYSVAVGSDRKIMLRSTYQAHYSNFAAEFNVLVKQNPHGDFVEFKKKLRISIRVSEEIREYYKSQEEYMEDHLKKFDVTSFEKDFSVTFQALEKFGIEQPLKKMFASYGRIGDLFRYYFDGMLEVAEAKIKIFNCMNKFKEIILFLEKNPKFFDYVKKHPEIETLLKKIAYLLKNKDLANGADQPLMRYLNNLSTHIDQYKVLNSNPELLENFQKLFKIKTRFQVLINGKLITLPMSEYLRLRSIFIPFGNFDSQFIKLANELGIKEEELQMILATQDVAMLVRINSSGKKDLSAEFHSLTKTWQDLCNISSKKIVNDVVKELERNFKRPQFINSIFKCEIKVAGFEGHIALDHFEKLDNEHSALKKFKTALEKKFSLQSSSSHPFLASIEAIKRLQEFNVKEADDHTMSELASLAVDALNEFNLTYAATEDVVKQWTETMADVRREYEKLMQCLNGREDIVPGLVGELKERAKKILESDLNKSLVELRADEKLFRDLYIEFDRRYEEMISTDDRVALRLTNALAYIIKEYETYFNGLKYKDVVIKNYYTRLENELEEKFIKVFKLTITRDTQNNIIISGLKAYSIQSFNQELSYFKPTINFIKNAVQNHHRSLVAEHDEVVKKAKILNGIKSEVEDLRSISRHEIFKKDEDARVVEQLCDVHCKKIESVLAREITEASSISDMGSFVRDVNENLYKSENIAEREIKLNKKLNKEIEPGIKVVRILTAKVKLINPNLDPDFLRKIEKNCKLQSEIKTFLEIESAKESLLRLIETELDRKFANENLKIQDKRTQITSQFYFSDTQEKMMKIENQHTKDLTRSALTGPNGKYKDLLKQTPHNQQGLENFKKYLGSVDKAYKTANDSYDRMIAYHTVSADIQAGIEESGKFLTLYETYKKLKEEVKNIPQELDIKITEFNGYFEKLEQNLKIQTNDSGTLYLVVKESNDRLITESLQACNQLMREINSELEKLRKEQAYTIKIEAFKKEVAKYNEMLEEYYDAQKEWQAMASYAPSQNAYSDDDSSSEDEASIQSYDKKDAETILQQCQSLNDLREIRKSLDLKYKIKNLSRYTVRLDRQAQNVINSQKKKLKSHLNYLRTHEDYLTNVETSSNFYAQAQDQLKEIEPIRQLPEKEFAEIITKIDKVTQLNHRIDGTRDSVQEERSQLEQQKSQQAQQNYKDYVQKIEAQLISEEPKIKQLIIQMMGGNVSQFDDEFNAIRKKYINEIFVAPSNVVEIYQERLKVGIIDVIKDAQLSQKKLNTIKQNLECMINIVDSLTNLNNETKESVTDFAKKYLDKIEEFEKNSFTDQSDLKKLKDYSAAAKKIISAHEHEYKSAAFQKNIQAVNKLMYKKYRSNLSDSDILKEKIKLIDEAAYNKLNLKSVPSYDESANIYENIPSFDAAKANYDLLVKTLDECISTKLKNQDDEVDQKYNRLRNPEFPEAKVSYNDIAEIGEKLSKDLMESNRFSKNRNYIELLRNTKTSLSYFESYKKKVEAAYETTNKDLQELINKQNAKIKAHFKTKVNNEVKGLNTLWQDYKLKIANDSLLTEYLKHKISNCNELIEKLKPFLGSKLDGMTDKDLENCSLTQHNLDSILSKIADARTQLTEIISTVDELEKVESKKRSEQENLLGFLNTLKNDEDYLTNVETSSSFYAQAQDQLKEIEPIRQLPEKDFAEIITKIEKIKQLSNAIAETKKVVQEEIEQLEQQEAELKRQQAEQQYQNHVQQLEAMLIPEEDKIKQLIIAKLGQASQFNDDFVRIRKSFILIRKNFIKKWDLSQPIPSSLLASYNHLLTSNFIEWIDKAEHLQQLLNSLKLNLQALIDTANSLTTLNPETKNKIQTFASLHIQQIEKLQPFTNSNLVDLQNHYNNANRILVLHDNEYDKDAIQKCIQPMKQILHKQYRSNLLDSNSLKEKIKLIDKTALENLALQTIPSYDESAKIYENIPCFNAARTNYNLLVKTLSECINEKLKSGNNEIKTKMQTLKNPEFTEAKLPNEDINAVITKLNLRLVKVAVFSFIEDQYYIDLLKDLNTTSTEFNSYLIKVESAYDTAKTDLQNLLDKQQAKIKAHFKTKVNNEVKGLNTLWQNYKSKIEDDSLFTEDLKHKISDCNRIIATLQGFVPNLDGMTDKDLENCSLTQHNLVSILSKIADARTQMTEVISTVDELEKVESKKRSEQENLRIALGKTSAELRALETELQQLNVDMNNEDAKTLLEKLTQSFSLPENSIGEIKAKHDNLLLLKIDFTTLIESIKKEKEEIRQKNEKAETLTLKINGKLYVLHIKREILEDLQSKVKGLTLEQTEKVNECNRLYEELKSYSCFENNFNSISLETAYELIAQPENEIEEILNKIEIATEKLRETNELLEESIREKAINQRKQMLDVTLTALETEVKTLISSKLGYEDERYIANLSEIRSEIVESTNFNKEITEEGVRQQFSDRIKNIIDGIERRIDESRESALDKLASLEELPKAKNKITEFQTGLTSATNLKEINDLSAQVDKLDLVIKLTNAEKSLQESSNKVKETFQQFAKYSTEAEIKAVRDEYADTVLQAQEAKKLPLEKQIEKNTALIGVLNKLNENIAQTTKDTKDRVDSAYENLQETSANFLEKLAELKISAEKGAALQMPMQDTTSLLQSSETIKSGAENLESIQDSETEINDLLAKLRDQTTLIDRQQFEIDTHLVTHITSKLKDKVEQFGNGLACTHLDADAKQKNSHVFASLNLPADKTITVEEVVAIVIKSHAIADVLQDVSANIESANAAVTLATENKLAKGRDEEGQQLYTKCKQAQQRSQELQAKLAVNPEQIKESKLEIEEDDIEPVVKQTPGSQELYAIWKQSIEGKTQGYEESAEKADRTLRQQRDTEIEAAKEELRENLNEENEGFKKEIKELLVYAVNGEVKNESQVETVLLSIDALQSKIADTKEFETEEQRAGLVAEYKRQFEETIVAAAKDSIQAAKAAQQGKIKKIKELLSETKKDQKECEAFESFSKKLLSHERMQDVQRDITKLDNAFRVLSEEKNNIDILQERQQQIEEEARRKQEEEQRRKNEDKQEKKDEPASLPVDPKPVENNKPVENKPVQSKRLKSDETKPVAPKPKEKTVKAPVKKGAVQVSKKEKDLERQDKRHTVNGKKDYDVTLGDEVDAIVGMSEVFKPYHLVLRPLTNNLENWPQAAVKQLRQLKHTTMIGENKTPLRDIKNVDEIHEHVSDKLNKAYAELQAIRMSSFSILTSKLFLAIKSTFRELNNEDLALKNRIADNHNIKSYMQQIEKLNDPIQEARGIAEKAEAQIHVEQTKGGETLCRAIHQQQAPKTSVTPTSQNLPSVPKIIPTRTQHTGEAYARYNLFSDLDKQPNHTNDSFCTGWEVTQQKSNSPSNNSQ